MPGPIRLVVGIAVAVALPASAAVAVAAPARNAEAGGVCTDLGCVGGDTRCATGTMNFPDGTTVTFTCYTTIRDS